MYLYFLYRYTYVNSINKHCLWSKRKNFSCIILVGSVIPVVGVTILVATTFSLL